MDFFFYFYRLRDVRIRKKTDSRNGLFFVSLFLCFSRLTNPREFC